MAVVSPPLSLRTYAKRRGVSPMAVSVAVRDGRLHRSVTRDANDQPKISDPELADREWDENTSAAHRERAMGPPEEEEHAPAVLDGEDPTARPGMTKAEADAVGAVWKARTLELQFKQQAEELVPAKDIAHKLAGVFVQCKTRLLALPSRARQELPHLSVSDIEVLDKIIRDALEDLAASAVLPEEPAE